MANATITLENDGVRPMNLHLTHAEGQLEPRGGSMRFAYPGGSRPLEGYTIKRGIGRGGFGEVYFAVSDAGKEVAIKLVRRNLDVELRGVSHCLNMRHPHLVEIYDIRQDELGDTWVVMEYVKGDCLENLIERSPEGLPLADSMRWMHGIASGVAYLHEHGVVHRDLKPGNIFCDEGFVKIGDYGLSKFISASRRSGQTESVGTVHYMAPEVANGRYGKEIDLYAMGIILYEMLTGKVPFDGESVGEVLMKHLTAEPDLSALQEPFRTVVARALDKDPNRRAKNVGDFMQGIEQMVTHAGHLVGSPWAKLGLNGNSLPVPLVPAAVGNPVTPPPVPSVPVLGHPGQTYASGMAVPGVVVPPIPLRVEEPLLRSIKSGVSNLARQWDASNLTPATKAILIVVVAIVGLNTIGLWFPIVGIAALCYCVYWPFWKLVLAPHQEDAMAAEAHRVHLARVVPPSVPVVQGVRTPPAQGVIPDLTPVVAVAQNASQTAQAAAVQAVNAVNTVNTANTAAPAIAAFASPFAPPAAPLAQVQKPGSPFRRDARELLGRKGRRERFSELLGSMLLASVICAMFSVAVAAIWPQDVGLAHVVWMSLTASSACWAIMIPSKYWETRDTDSGVRRLVQASMGIGVGLFAWVLGDFLMVQPHYHAFVDNRWPVSFQWGGFAPFAPDGAPQLVYLAYFGLLFGMLKWWKGADPLRSKRFRFAPVLVALGWAFMLGWAWHFPQPSGMEISAIAAAALQLSSPWLGATYATYGVETAPA